VSEDQKVLRKLRRGELFALWRCVFWLVNMPTAIGLYAFDKPIWLQVSVLYLVIVSIYANIESAYSSLSAKRAERRSLENPPAE
jgi:hypothetical protein